MAEQHRHILDINDQPYPEGRADPHCIACERGSLVRLLTPAEQVWTGDEWTIDYSTPTFFKCVKCGKKSKTALWIDHEGWKPDDDDD